MQDTHLNLGFLRVAPRPAGRVKTCFLQVMTRPAGRVRTCFLQVTTRPAGRARTCTKYRGVSPGRVGSRGGRNLTRRGIRFSKSHGSNSYPEKTANVVGCVWQKTASRNLTNAVRFPRFPCRKRLRRFRNVTFGFQDAVSYRSWPNLSINGSHIFLHGLLLPRASRCWSSNGDRR